MPLLRFSYKKPLPSSLALSLGLLCWKLAEILRVGLYRIPNARDGKSFQPTPSKELKSLVQQHEELNPANSLVSEFGNKSYPSLVEP